MRTRPRRLAPLLIALTLGAACSPSPTAEGQLLRRYFEACRLHDTTALARLATAPCNPRTVGVVEDFEIVAAGEAREREDGLTVRDVTLSVRMRSLDSQGTAGTAGTATATLQRLDGRWIVAAFTPPPASQTSPAASSGPPR